MCYVIRKSIIEYSNDANTLKRVKIILSSIFENPMLISWHNQFETELQILLK